MKGDQMLVGCYTPDRGTGSGIAVVAPGRGVTSIIRASSPAFVVRHPRLSVIYAVAEESIGRVAAWQLDSEADTTEWPGGTDTGAALPLGIGETGGSDPCHLAVHESGQWLVTVNYGGGSVCVHRLGPDGGIGERTAFVQHTTHGAHERQDGPHAHMVRLDGDRALVTDLGGDTIYEYAFDAIDGTLTLVRAIAAPASSGPRHFRPLGGDTVSAWLVGAELSGEVLVFEPDWTLRGTVPTTVSDKENLVSEIATDAAEHFLYVANRGPDTVSVFRLGGQLPEYVTEVPTGAWPRHILVDGDLLYVANQLSDEVTTMRIDPATGVPEVVDRLAVPSPTCVVL